MTRDNGRALLHWLQDHRSAGQLAWSVPAFATDAMLGVFPLCARVEERLIPIGTAFSVSKLGFVASALHNVQESLKYHRLGDRLRSLDSLPNPMSLGDLGLSVVNGRMTSPDAGQLTVWPLESGSGAPPTDLLIGFPRYQQQVPWLALPVSFAVPRIGSKVYCIGYGHMQYPEHGIPIDEESLTRGDSLRQLMFDLTIVEATVSTIFVERFARRYIEGPCIAVDGDVVPGQSGGPVLNEDGYVCGVISASASSWFDRPTGLVSLLYPMLPLTVKFGVQLGPVRIQADYSVIERIRNGDMVTDESETLVGLVENDDGLSVAPRIINEDRAHVFADFAAFQSGTPAARLGKPAKQLRWHNAPK